MNEKDKKEQKTLTQEQVQEIVYENLYLKERERLLTLKENMKDNDQFKLYQIEKLETQNQLLLTLNENLLVLIEKLKTGLNSTNQQLYNLALTLSSEDSRQSESVAILSDNDDGLDVSNENDEPDEPETTEDQEEIPEEEDEEDDKTLKSDEMERLPERDKGYFNELEKRRNELKKQAVLKGKNNKLTEEKIQKAIQDDKRIEARAKLKAEEILIKKEIEDSKKKVRHIPDEIRKEFEEKYGRF